MKRFTVGLFILFLAMAVWGQEGKPSLFSLQPLNKKGADSTRWFFTAEGWYQNQKGNTKELTTDAGVSLKYDDNITSFLIGGSINYTEGGSCVAENNGNAILKYDHYVHERWELFGFTQNEYDELGKLIYRNNSGGGAKFVFFRNAFWKVDLSAAPIYQYENYEDVAYETDFRGSFRGRIKMKPYDGVTAQVTGFYVPKIMDVEKYRTSVDSWLQFGLPTLISNRKQRGLYFKIGYLTKFNSAPAAGTEKRDDNYYARVVLRM